MDIIDIMLAKALTPQGQADSAAAAAQNSALEAYNSMEAAVEAANEALSTLEEANAAIETANSAVEGIEDTITNEIDKLAFSLTSTNITNGTRYDLLISHEDLENKQVPGIIKLYNTTGNNTDGSMTQQAITAALQEISQTPSSNNTYLGTNNAGKIVVVGNNGYIQAGELTEEDIITGSGSSEGGSSIISGTVGIEIDYINKSFRRIQEAMGKQGGTDFNTYLMYGGRKRCNVANNGSIVAWYGDGNYAEDGSNGQVMIYQPKFYYNRTIISSDINELGGTIIRKETITLSYTQRSNFKLHPLFIAENGEELDYVLLSAYEGSAYKTGSATYDQLDGLGINFNTDMLSSIAGVKPISGAKVQFTSQNAEKMAQNRGQGWHITNLAAESALQLLLSVEYNTLNAQSAIGKGVTDITSVIGINCSSLTGSTSSLGDASGMAASTINEINGTYNTYTEEGYTAVSYRGMENPWGNLWRTIGGLNIVGDGTKHGGVAYICKNYTYNTININDNYTAIGFELPNNIDWISGFGYNNNTLDWTFIPAEMDLGNSALPVGDIAWITSNLNAVNKGLIGGVCSHGSNCGIFNYAFDRPGDEYTRASGARLMFIPNKNSIYYDNIQKWSNKMGV